MLVNYFILALKFALAICVLYILYKVGITYIISNNRYYMCPGENFEPGTWVMFAFRGQEIFVKVPIRDFKPVFTHLPETGEIVFEDVYGCKYRVHTHQWILVDVPEEGDAYDA